MLKANKGLKDFARKLVGLSVDEEGSVTNERVGGVLQALAVRPHRHLRTLLKLYLLYIRHELRKSEAVVEHAGVISTDSLRRIEEVLTARYSRAVTATARENRDLIAGVRISVGDDFYDTTVLGRLEAFSRNIG